MFGSIETGQVSVFFDDIHLFTGPKTQKESYHDRNFLKSKFFTFNKYKGQEKTCFKDVRLVSIIFPVVISAVTKILNPDFCNSQPYHVYITHIPVYRDTHVTQSLNIF